MILRKCRANYEELTSLINKSFYFPYGVSGAAQWSGDLDDDVSKALEPQNFAIIYHDHRPP